MNSQPASQSSRLYVGGLNLSVTQKDVDDLFNKFGKILEIRMNRNFAFVQFAEESEAQSAIKELNGTQHFGRRLDVQIARHPKSGGGGGGAGGGGGGPGPNKMDDIPSRDGRDRSPIGGRGGGPGRGGMGGGVGGRGGFGGRGGDRGGMYNSGGGGRGGFNDEPGFGGRSGGDFRGGPDYRGGGDFPPRQESSFGRSSDSGLFGGSGGGRDFSLAPPTGFRDSGRGSGWGSGGGVGVGLNDKAFEPRPRGGDLGPSISSYNQDRPPTHPVEPVSVPNNERTNDIEIIIVDKALTEYGEMIERRMSCLGFSVDVLFPHEAVPLARVLANIASRGTLYAAVITHVHQINGSLTLHILHGRPQEHRNMAIDDAITLLLRNYETYTRSCKEKGGPNCPPEQVRHLLQQVLNGRQLTTTQYDILVQYLLQEKLKSEPQLNQPGNNSQNSTAQQAELQTRILSILNKTSVGDAQQAPPVLPPHGPLLQDPSIQKALDNLIQGGDILRKIAPQQPNPFGRY